MAKIVTDTYDIDISQIAKKMGLTIKQQKELQKQLAKAQQGFKQGQKSGESFLGSLIKFNVVAGIFRGITGAIGGAVKGLVSYNKEMAKLFAITNASKKDQQALRDTAEQLGKTTAFTATEVAQLQQEYAKLGFSVSEINAMSKATVDLAVFTEDTAQTAQTAGATLKAFGLQAKDSQKLIDLMAASFNKSALDLTKFQESMKLAAPIAKAFGITVEETTAMLGTLANVGIAGSLAGTGLRNMMSQLADESSNVSQVLGGTATNFEELVDLLVKAKERGQEFNEDALKNLDQRVKGVVINLVNNVDALKNLNTEFGNVSGTAKKMADDAIDNLAGSFTLLNSALSGLVNDKGSGVYQLLNKVIKGAIPVVEWLGKNIVTVGNIAITAVLIPAVKGLITWVKGLSFNISLATGGLNLLVGAISFFIANKFMKTMTEDQKGYNAQLKEFDKDSKKFVENLKDMKNELLKLNIQKANEELLDLKKRLRMSPEDTALREEIAKVQKFLNELNIEALKRIKQEFAGLGELFKSNKLELPTIKIKGIEIDDSVDLKEMFPDTIMDNYISKLEKAQSLIGKEIEQRKRLRDTVLSYNLTEEEQFRETQQNKLNMLKKALDQGVIEQDEYLDQVKRIHEETNQEITNKTIESAQEALSVLADLQSSISGIFSQLSTNRMIEIDNEYKKQKDNINKNYKNEEVRAEKLAELEEKYEKQKRDQKKKNAENEKLSALFQVAITTAQNIVKAFGNPFLMAAAAALGATQAGVIAAQPVPEFAQGVVGFNGSGADTSDSNLVKISRNESVITAAGTRAGSNAQVLTDINRGGVFTDQTGVINQMRNDIKGLSAIMANLDLNVNVINEVNEDGLTTIVEKGMNKFTDNNNRISTESAV